MRPVRVPVLTCLALAIAAPATAQLNLADREPLVIANNVISRLNTLNGSLTAISSAGPLDATKVATCADPITGGVLISGQTGSGPTLLKGVAIWQPYSTSSIWNPVFLCGPSPSCTNTLNTLYAMSTGTVYGVDGSSIVVQFDRLTGAQTILAGPLSALNIGMTQDAAGRLILAGNLGSQFGVAGANIVRYDPVTNQFTALVNNNGVLLNAARGVVVQPNGRLMVASGSRLVEVDLSVNPPTVTTFASDPASPAGATYTSLVREPSGTWLVGRTPATATPTVGAILRFAANGVGAPQILNGSITAGAGGNLPLILEYRRYSCVGDNTGDGRVDFNDLSNVIGNYGTQCFP